MIVASDAAASVTSDSVMPPTPEWSTRARHLVRTEPAERADQRLHRALDIGLDNERKLALALLLLDFGEELLQVERRAARDLFLPGARLPELGDLPRPALVLDHHDLIARQGRAAEPENLDGHRRPCGLGGSAVVAVHRPHPAPLRTGDDDIANAERAALDQHGGHCAAAPVHLGLDHDALGSAIRVGGELQQLRLEQDRLLQPVEVEFLGRRYLDREHVAAHRLGHDFVLEQVLAHPPGIGVGPVHLVDGDEDRHTPPRARD